MRKLAVAFALLLAVPAAAQLNKGQTTMGAHNARAPSLPVKVENKTLPEVCAERDNIDIRFTNPEVRSFRIQAVHPAYIGMLREDLALPDFAECDMSKDPVFNAGKPRQITLYETPELSIVGQVYASFWRPASVPVKVGEKTFEGLHLVQVYKRVDQRVEEMLVVYPQDGYWRARPLAPAHMSVASYGSSFMVGPVVDEGRPIVALKEIRIAPETLTFTFPFRDGGQGELKMAALDRDHQVLDIKLSGDLPKDKPFAALRSMYITEINNDAARIAARDPASPRWLELNVLDYKGGQATDFWLGRHTPSRHNMASPDMLLGNFGK
ncbi:MAG: hypothetical protein LCH39_00940 [Proteobacteria bacterium]|nr:hypothetical protein [Pseudomonadota bacterium]